MARVQEINIAGVCFKTKAALKAFCKEMLGRYSDQQTVNAEDFKFLVALVQQRHSHGAEKIGCGAARIFKAPAPPPNYGTSCFWIERIDGTVERFSYINCLKGGAE